MNIRLITYSLLSKVFVKCMNILSRIKSVDGKILMFHHVGNFIDGVDLSCQCSVDQFKDILISLKTCGYDFVTLDEAVELVNESSKSSFVVVTFDDANESVFENAYPILKEFNIPFVIYITIDYIGKRDFLKSEQIQVLSKEKLCTFGAHTITHTDLRNNVNYKDEIIQGKIKLEKITNTEIKHFAYPYGKFSSVGIKHIRFVKKSNFKSAVSSYNYKLSFLSRRNVFFLPRIVINGVYKN